jgi:hypothetical protein
MELKIYRLQNLYVPDAIDSGMILTQKDMKVGGIRLVYEITNITDNTKKLGVFLNPFKEYWEPNGKKSCKKGEWGSSRTNLSAVWIELDRVWEDYTKENYIFNSRVINPTLLGNLNKRSKLFELITGNYNTIPLKERLKYKVSMSLDSLKSNLRKHFIN